MEIDPQNSLRLVYALGNLKFGSQEAIELADALAIKVDLTKLDKSGPDAVKTIEKVTEVAKEAGLA